MATGTLTNTAIKDRYKSLLKITGTANDEFSGTIKLIEDGNGNDSVLGLATDSALISGNGTRLYFYDADGGEYISADNAAKLTIAGGAEVEVNTAIFDVNASGAISIDSSAGSIDMNVVDGQTVAIGLNGGVETLWKPHGTAGSELWSTINTAGTTDGTDAAGSILLSAVAGGIGLAWNDGKDLWAEGGRFVVTANEDAADAIKLHADAGTSQTITILNDAGTGANAIGLTADAGGITVGLGGGAGDDFIVDTTTLVVESDNNRVGIGTAAPAALLHVDGGSAATELLIKTGNEDPMLHLLNSTEDWVIGLDYSDNSQLQFCNSAVPGTNVIMSLDPDTNRVGIGTTSPAYLLELEGDNTTALSIMNQSDTAIDDGDTLGTIYFGGKDEESAGTNVLGAKIVAQAAGLWETGASDNDAPTELQFFTQSDGGTDNLATPKMVIRDHGYVGIGTTSPDASLEIVNFNSGSWQASTIVDITSYSDTVTHPSVLNLRKSKYVSGETPLATADDEDLGQIAFYGTSDESPDAFKLAAYILCEQDASATTTMSGRLKFITRNADSDVNAMTILKNGKVGIGTTSPDTVLHLQGDVGTALTDAFLKMEADSTSGASNGDFIGTLYSSRPNGPGKTFIGVVRTATYGRNDIVFACDNAADDNVVGSEDEVMRITSGGNVGIGVDDPASQLEVNSGGASAATEIIIDATAGQNSLLKFREDGDTYWEIYHNEGEGNRLQITDSSGDGAYLTMNETSEWDWSSDISLKTDISSISNALSKINSIRGVNYKWKKYKEGASNPNPEEITEDMWTEMRPKRDINRIGVIAQEVNEVLPEAVNTDMDGKWTVKRGLLVPLLIEAVKELSAKVTALENA